MGLLDVRGHLPGFAGKLVEREVLGDAEEKGFGLFDLAAILLDAVSLKVSLLGDVFDVLFMAQESGQEFLEERVVVQKDTGDARQSDWDCVSAPFW